MSVALITGCSSGIGLATAVEFARRGCTTVATMRNPDRSEALRSALSDAGLVADIRALDVADDTSVSATMAAITVDHGGVDVIVSNAGIGIDGTTEELTIDDFRNSFETNTLGSVRLLHAVLPAWRARGAGRFIAVGSLGGVVGNPFNDAYCASKFALEGLLESLHPVAAQHGINVSIVEPGPVSGDFAHKYGPGGGRPAEGPYAASRARFQVVQDGGYAAAQTNAEIAEILWQVAEAEAPLLRYQTSEMVSKMLGLKLKDMSGERVIGMTSRWI
jgi:NAD(P)-dependent dehydrogenase (short-subunit alcohol dehydrogenase family)